ncbi:MAG TPA: choice-of-anchor B family protein [Pyrinomonadaceae bacterium]|nr:choice-of-anchor B family protein [Pyrinomonadaceae bacterium]
MKTRTVLVTLALLFALSLAVWVVGAHEGEHHSPGGNGQPNDAPLTAMGLTPCVNGFAGTFPCNRVDLAALLPVADIDGTTAAGVTSNDVWGWTDPSTDREYALLGLSNGVAFVDVTNPSAPVYLGNLPTHTVDSLWRGMKVYRNYLYVVSEAADHGLQVFDLTRLRGVSSPQVFTENSHYNNFTSAHTVNVDEETGFLYVAGSRPNPARTPNVDTCPGATSTRGGGLHMIDVRNPAAPAFAGCVNDDGYTHETECLVYRGPDVQYRGREICFSSNEDTLTIVDVTNKSAPVQLSRTGYAGSGYTHQGWLTGDQTRFLLDDELDEQHSNPQNPGQSALKTQTFVWDVSDLDAPFVQNVYHGPVSSIDHNLYVRGLHAFESNYRSGVRVLDTTQAAAGNLTEVAFFDVYPADDQSLFNGTWSNYPFFASGTVVASGIEQGLFVLRPQISLPVRIDYEPYFVRQHYRDFLSRDPDAQGLAFWQFEMDKCGPDAQCREVKRINVSAAFFLSIEFQNTGYLLYRLQKSSFGTMPAFNPFMSDVGQLARELVVGQAGWEAQLETNKRTFVESWVQRPAFVADFPQGMSAQDYVAKLFQRAGAAPTAAEVQSAVDAYGSGDTQGRARALRAVVEGQTITNAHKNPAYVLMEYFGYLRRDPDVEGFNHWLTKLDQFNGDAVAAEMVKAFITSIEYRQRFGQ